MFTTLRNLFINIMAVFIRDKDERNKFRTRYKAKSKFRKLRDDNTRLFDQNRILEEKINKIQKDLAFLTKMLRNHTWLNPLEENPTTYLSIACIAKDEGLYLKEWIEYHRIVGVERFYFYDNESSDNTKEILEPYIRDEVVVYRYVEGKVMQRPVYQDAILKSRGQTRWLALIDLDEFIVPVQKNSIPDFLRDYEQYPGVGINWLCFDHNGHETRPKEHGGLVTANYTRVAKHPEEMEGNRIIKSIVNPNEVVFLDSPHNFEYKNSYAVTENYDPAWYKTKYYSGSKIRINNYCRKSIEEYKQKMSRGCAWNRHNANYKEGRVYIFENIETDHDYTIQKYMPALKKVMGIEQ